jgi:protein-S-isoprenylcysteine O-methyltransferase Ste14
MKLKSWIFAVFFVGIFWIGIPFLLIILNDLLNFASFQNLALKIIGICLMLLDAMIFFYCSSLFSRFGKGNPIITEGVPKNLVKNELYTKTRNPIYIGHILGILGIASFFGRMLLFAYAAFIAVGIHLVVVFIEEPFLKKTFGKEYDKYVKMVRRWV